MAFALDSVNRDWFSLRQKGSIMGQGENVNMFLQKWVKESEN